MAKYLEHDGAGGAREVNAATTGGAPDANKIPQLDANGKFTAAMMPSGIGADSQVFQASENLSAGDLVNIWSSTGAFRVRRADASGGTAKKAMGYVLAAVTSGQNATVFFEGTNDQIATVLTPGDCYLSAAQPGQVTQTAPTTATHIVQRVGFASTSTALNFEASDPITLA